MEQPVVSAYRWIILAAIVPIIAATEMMWLSLAPISSQAAGFFKVSDMNIALFSMSYMIMYILFALPASWVIDRFGFRASLTIGALLTAVFGLARAYFIHDFALVLASQFLIAIGQPFLLNITTKVPANWFPVSERVTAAGLLTMAQYVGFALAMVLSPMLAGAEAYRRCFGRFACLPWLQRSSPLSLHEKGPRFRRRVPCRLRRALLSLPSKRFSESGPLRLCSSSASYPSVSSIRY